jgi:hypothetical protein
MAKEQSFFGTNRGLGLHASRRGLLQAGLAIGTLALGQRAALGQSGGAHVHMPELGVATLPVVPAMDQPLVEPEVRRSVNGVLSTTVARPDAAHEAWRDPEGPAHQRPAAQPRFGAPGSFASASIQQHELPFPRRALQPERHRRQRHALDGARQVVRHRDHAARGPHARHILVSCAPPRLRRCAGGERHGRRHHRRRRLRRCAGDRPGA